jgi:uncharacterized protein (DUF58 family)
MNNRPLHQTVLSGLRPHIPGLIYVGLVLLVGVAAMNNQNNLLFWVLGIMVSALVISAVLSSFIVRAIQVRRIDPQHGAVGEPLIVRYAVRNHSRWLSAFNITIAEQPARVRQGQTWRSFMQPAGAWVMHVGPRETVHGEAIFWPKRRGDVVFDAIGIATSFPFGIVRKAITISQPQHTLIYPMLYELQRGLLNKITPAGLMGTKVTHHAGAGDEYYGVREYKPGDSLRHIAWKRTGRTEELVTIERTHPSPAKLRVILDLTVPTDQLHVEPHGPDAARELEERAISLAASIIHAADMDGYEVGLTILGMDGPAIAIRRNQWHSRKIMAALAGIDLDAPRRSSRTQPLRDAERAGIVVIAPDRVRPIAGRENAWYLTARQLDALAVRPIGWDPKQRAALPGATGQPSTSSRRPTVRSEAA